MRLRHPRSNLTDTHFPYTTLCLAGALEGLLRHIEAHGGGGPAERAEEPGEPVKGVGEEADRAEEHDGLRSLRETAEIVDRLGAARRRGNAALGGQRREGEEGGAGADEAEDEKGGR